MVHLFVALAQVARRADRVAKRTIKSAGVFGAVRHDACVYVPLRFQRLADGANASVHHVAGRHDVDTGVGLGQGLLHQHFHCGVIHDVAGVVQQTILTMTGERVECHIGHHAQFRKMLLQTFDHARHQTFGVGGFTTVRRFQRRVNHWKQGHHRNAQLDAFFGDRQQQIEAEPFNAGHRGHRFTLFLAIQHKHRVNQVIHAQGVFAHQAAGEVVAGQAAQACMGEWGRSSHKGNCAALRGLGLGVKPQ